MRFHKIKIMEEETVESNISGLTEGCISNILSLTSPSDAISLSLVSPTWKSAADSDHVWERFLPEGYREMVASAVPPVDLGVFKTTKELFFALCARPIVFSDQKLSFNLDRASGKKCFMLAATELRIVWGNTPQYWTWTADEQSRFGQVAELLRVCWFLIEGTIDTRVLSPKTTYMVYIVVKFSENAYGLDYPPMQVTVKFAGEDGIASGTHAVYLDPERNRRPHMQYPLHGHGLLRRRFAHILRPPLATYTVPIQEVLHEGQFPRERGDGWMEVELGEFYNDDGEGRQLEVSLAETTSGEWKSGLIIQGIEVRPKKIVAERGT